MALFSYSGNGILTSEDNTITIPIQFTCSQLYDGTLEGEIQPTAKVSELLLAIMLKGIGFNIVGKTNEGYQLMINKAKMKLVSTDSLKYREISLYIQKRTLKSDNSSIMLNYGITCFDSLKVEIDTNVGKITFEPIKDYDTVLNLIKDYGRVCLTSVAQLSVKPEIKRIEAKDYVDITKDELWKVLDLTSFGQGIYQSILRQIVKLMVT